MTVERAITIVMRQGEAIDLGHGKLMAQDGGMLIIQDRRGNRTCYDRTKDWVAAARRISPPDSWEVWR